MTEILKQGQYQPLPVQEQIADLWMAGNGFLDNVPVLEVREFEVAYLDYLRTANPDLLDRIAQEKQLTDAITEELRTATEAFKAGSRWATTGTRSAA